VELDAYRDRGTPQTTKHLKAMHKKYCLLIDQQVGQEADPNNNVKTPRVPEPKAYNEEDAEVFDRCLTSLLKWLRINKYCGQNLDKNHIVCMAIFLQGPALIWSNNNVDGMDHQKDTWSFKTVVIRLYDCFIHEVALGAVSDKFRGTTYTADKGVMAFYHRITRYTVQMVRPPDRYSFKKQYILKLTKIFDHLLIKEVTPEFSKMETILHHTWRAEEIAFQTYLHQK
jgi:hypothetical protein